jgi:hypothetical protein
MGLPKNCNECSYFKESCTNVDADESLVITDQNILPSMCPLLDDELYAKRFKVTYRGEKLYVVISIKNGIPYEVFAEHATNSDHKLIFLLSGWDALTRMISLCLKVYPIDKVIRQLKKASRQPSDIPGILSDLLSKMPRVTLPVRK